MIYRFPNRRLGWRASVGLLLIGTALATPSLSQAASCTISPQSSSINTGGQVSWSAAYTGFSGTPSYRWTFQEGDPDSSERSTRTVSYEKAGTFTTSLTLRRGDTRASCSTTVKVSAPDTQAPSQPGIPSAVAVSPSQVNLSWSASTDNVGVTGYRVFRCTGSSSCTPTTLIATTTTTGYSDTGLSASTLYRYRVRAQGRGR